MIISYLAGSSLNSFSETSVRTSCSSYILPREMMSAKFFLLRSSFRERCFGPSGVISKILSNFSLCRSFPPFSGVYRRWDSLLGLLSESATLLWLLIRFSSSVREPKVFLPGDRWSSFVPIKPFTLSSLLLSSFAEFRSVKLALPRLRLGVSESPQSPNFIFSSACE